ncbi:MAG: PilC/PilY family type IV pilus protein [Halioglobus sp.]|nr:PilC/PilY family type IV pilus protein [Halioglobus sp.]
MKFFEKTAYGCLAALAFASAFQAFGAVRFSPDSQPLGSIAPIVLSGSDLSAGNVKAYRPWFENGSWQGDIAEYTVSTTGGLTTSVDYSGTSPVNTGDPAANWSALVSFAASEAADADYWNTGREVITWDGLAQVPFRWGDATIGLGNMALIDPTAVGADAASSDILDWVRGDRSNEYPAAKALRSRISVLGSIIHSNPVYVADPIGGRTDEGYATWAAGKLDRESRIYVGSNDGMVHALNASNGSEVYAYIPSMLMGNLSKLVARPYAHHYFVDGKLTVGDANFGGGNSDWHTVLVGTLGAGGRGLFALDITDPDLNDETATTGTDVKVLWEVNADADDDLGDSFSRGIIAKLNDDNWYVVVGNGYNSVNGVAKLYIINIETGAIVKRITTASGTSGSPNGLSSPTLLDVDKDGRVDYAYAGDIDGNLWKFDLSGNTSGSWALAPAQPLHPAAAGQSITMAPEIAKHPDSGYLLFFATGRLFTLGDKDVGSAQSVYGIRDSDATPAGPQVLLDQTWKGPLTYTYTDTDGATVEETVAIYAPDAGDVDWSTKHGWKFDLPDGFRVLEGIQLRGSRIKVTASKPSPDSSVQQENYLVEASINDGGPHNAPVFDLNVDGLLSDADRYDDDADPGVEDWQIPMAWRRSDGIASRVTIARISSGVDNLYLNFLQPPLATPCEGDCDGGFQGGHIDVDTWHNSEPFAGKSTKHDHEYDKKTGRVYVDFFDIDLAGHVEINSTGTPAPASDIDPDEAFVVLVANADFSPGSTMQIGNKTWSVVEYQRQIHTALKNWDASNSSNVPVDSDGDSLIFTWAEIEAGGGTISHSFNDIAILAGGLHPTQTGCVKDSAYDTYDPSNQEGRWRNGALTTQLVKASHFSANPAISQVTIQDPDDLVATVIIQDGTAINLYEDFDNSGGELQESNHEIMGGTLASSGTEHVWESTLFWHFGNLSKLILGVKPCYGDPDWAAAVILEQSNDPFAAVLEYLEIEDLDAELAALVCKDFDTKKNKCKKYEDQDYAKLLLNLVKLRPDYEGGGDDGGDSSADTPGDGQTALVIPGGVEDDDGAGVDFKYGRKSWTDLVPD